MFPTRGPEADSLFWTVAKSSTFAHIKPASKLLGIRGRTPKYRFGLYGPQSKDPLEAPPFAEAAQAARLDNERVAKIETITRVTQPRKTCSIFTD